MRIKRAFRVVCVLAGMAVGCAIDDTAASDQSASMPVELTPGCGISLDP